MVGHGDDIADERHDDGRKGELQLINSVVLFACACLFCLPGRSGGLEK